MTALAPAPKARASTRRAALFFFPLSVWLGVLSPAFAAPGIADFALKDQLGKEHHLRDDQNAKAIVVIGQGDGCPIIREELPAIRALQADFAPKGVVFLMVNANPQDAPADVAREAKKFGIDMPILIDSRQTVVRSLGIWMTAEAVIINPANWTIEYRGAVNDQFTFSRGKPVPRHRYVRDALTSFLAGRPIRVARSRAFGCIYTLR
jgi:peroxiredoxin